MTSVARDSLFHTREAERSGSLFLITMRVIMRRDEASDSFPESSNVDSKICRRVFREHSFIAVAAAAAAL